MPTPSVAPTTTVEPAESVAPASSERVQCIGCSKVFNGGAVVTLLPADRDQRPLVARGKARSRIVTIMPERGQRPGWSSEFRTHFVTRVLYCDHCDHLQMWDQACDAQGNLEDAVLSRRPDIIKRRDHIALALRYWPQLKGVQQT